MNFDHTWHFDYTFHDHAVLSSGWGFEDADTHLFTPGTFMVGNDQSQLWRVMGTVNTDFSLHDQNGVAITQESVREWAIKGKGGRQDMSYPHF